MLEWEVRSLCGLEEKSGSLGTLLSVRGKEGLGVAFMGSI